MAGEKSTAGIVVKIGSTAIPGCCSTPDMGSEPGKIDVTSFDDKTYKRYIPDLIDTSTLNFDFYSNGSNYTTAKGLESKDGNTQVSVAYPDGDTISLKGSVAVYKLAANVGGAVKFRVAVTVSEFDDVASE